MPFRADARNNKYRDRLLSGSRQSASVASDYHAEKRDPLHTRRDHPEQPLWPEGNHRSAARSRNNFGNCLPDNVYNQQKKVKVIQNPGNYYASGVLLLLF